MGRSGSERDKMSFCMENWNWGVDSTEKVKQKIAKKLRRIVAKKLMERDKREVMSCLTTVSQLLSQIHDLQNKVNSLSDARAFEDPEAASSSGATHVPDRTAKKSESQDHALPRFWIAAQCSDKPLLSSLIPRTWHFLLQLLGSDNEGNTWRPEREMRREPQLSSIPVTYSQSGLIGCPRFPISELHLAKFTNYMEFHSWKVSQLQNWRMFKDSRSSSHNAMDQRSWDC